MTTVPCPVSYRWPCLQVLHGPKNWPGCSSTTWTMKLLGAFSRLRGRHSLSKWQLQLAIRFHKVHSNGELSGNTLPEQYSDWNFNFHKTFIYGVHNTQKLYSCPTKVIYCGTRILSENKLYLHYKDQPVNFM